MAGLSLFWRTFFLLTLLLLACVLAWTQTLRKMEFEPRAIQTARQIASVVNLSRTAVIHSDAIARVSLFKTMKDQEGVTIRLREPKDIFVALPDDALNRRITEELQQHLGSDTVVARSVNQIDGLWIGFGIDRDRYWLQTDRERFDPATGRTWLIWLATAMVLSLAGAAGMAGLINRPLKDLSIATGRVRAGDFEASRLDESVVTSEIRAVNVGFNRMTQKLAKVEEDRAVMLAGISHDLRTPLARLRLEAELSVEDAQAREHMVDDIGQIDAIIGKFLDYAKPGSATLQPVLLNDLIDQALAPMQKRHDMQCRMALQPQLLVLADPVELSRVISNLLENAVRYGKSADTGQVKVDISARSYNKQIHLRLRDHGPGVPAEQIKQLTTPFFRGESGRTANNSTGLGLAIVEQTVARLGGSLELSNATGGGLCASLRLPQAMPSSAT